MPWLSRPNHKCAYRIKISFKSEWKGNVELAINIAFAKKDTKRSVNYRKRIIVVITYCRGKNIRFAQFLLETLVKIQMLLYAGENKRNPKHAYSGLTIN